MSEDQIRADVEQTHKVFDDCDIPRQKRNNPLSLRIRAEMLAEKLKKAEARAEEGAN